MIEGCIPPQYWAYISPCQNTIFRKWTTTIFRSQVHKVRIGLLFLTPCECTLKMRKMCRVRNSKSIFIIIYLPSLHFGRTYSGNNIMAGRYFVTQYCQINPWGGPEGCDVQLATWSMTSGWHHGLWLKDGVLGCDFVQAPLSTDWTLFIRHNCELVLCEVRNT